MVMLSRNSRISVGFIPTSDFDGGSTKEVDPLSPDFSAPDWLKEKPTPWNLVSYWRECLERTIIDGDNRSLVNGHRAELRPAKTLLSKCGGDVNLAARVILYTSRDVQCNVTLYRALDRVRKVKGCLRGRSRLKPNESE